MRRRCSPALASVINVCCCTLLYQAATGPLHYYLHCLRCCCCWPLSCRASQPCWFNAVKCPCCLRSSWYWSAQLLQHQQSCQMRGCGASCRGCCQGRFGGRACVCSGGGRCTVHCVLRVVTCGAVRFLPAWVLSYSLCKASSYKGRVVQDRRCVLCLPSGSQVLLLWQSWPWWRFPRCGGIVVVVMCDMSECMLPSWPCCTRGVMARVDLHTAFSVESPSSAALQLRAASERLLKPEQHICRCVHARATGRAARGCHKVALAGKSCIGVWRLRVCLGVL